MSRWLPAHVSPENWLPQPPSTLAWATGEAIARVVGAICGALADLVLPPTCPGCRARVAAGGGLCVACWQSLRPIEEPWCERLGLPFAYDLGPGTLSAAAIAMPPAYDRARAAVAYEGVAPALVHAFKYGDRTELSAFIAAQMMRAGRELLAECDALVPVPLHRWRLFARRFNQAGLLARSIGLRSGRPDRPDFLVRSRATRRQVGLTREGRADNMRGVFAVPGRTRDEVRGKRILLVDDVLTTGATLEAAARVLKRAGAARVDVLTFARVAAMP